MNAGVAGVHRRISRLHQSGMGKVTGGRIFPAGAAGVAAAGVFFSAVSLASSRAAAVTSGESVRAVVRPSGVRAEIVPSAAIESAGCFAGSALARSVRTSGESSSRWRSEAICVSAAEAADLFSTVAKFSFGAATCAADFASRAAAHLSIRVLAMEVAAGMSSGNMAGSAEQRLCHRGDGGLFSGCGNFFLQPGARGAAILESGGIFPEDKTHFAHRDRDFVSRAGRIQAPSRVSLKKAMKVKVTPAARKKAKGRKSRPVPAKPKVVAGKAKAAIRKRPADNVPHALAAARLERMAALVDLSPDTIAIASLARRVLFWSAGAAAATGRSAKEAVGADFFKLLRIAKNTALAETFGNVAAGGEWEGEFEIAAPDGAIRTLHGHWKFMRGGRAAAGSVLLLNRDITELKNTRMGSVRAQRLDNAGELACTIAHDLNNVLVPIVIGADALEAMSLGGESDDVVKLIQESALRAAKIVRQVLLFVRGHDGEESPATNHAAEPSSHSDSPQANGELIIVADDEPVIAELCRCVLESHGYRAEVAADGVAALALFDQHRSSVRAVISDMAMPFMDGVDLTRAIRRLDPKVPILIATGAADTTALRALEPFPSVTLLSKPYTQRGLIEALQDCLDLASEK